MGLYENVTLAAEQVEKGVATLNITEENVRWGPEVVFDYVNIILHAMCTDAESYPVPCIYLQVEKGESMEEFRFIPRNSEVLQQIFDELSKNAAKHVDEDMENAEASSDDELFDATTNAAKLQKLESVFVEPQGMPPPVPGQFDEVDEDEDYKDDTDA